MQAAWGYVGYHVVVVSMLLSRQQRSMHVQAYLKPDEAGDCLPATRPIPAFDLSLLTYHVFQLLVDGANKRQPQLVHLQSNTTRICPVAACKNKHSDHNNGCMKATQVQWCR